MPKYRQHIRKQKHYPYFYPARLYRYSDCDFTVPDQESVWRLFSLLRIKNSLLVRDIMGGYYDYYV